MLHIEGKVIELKDIPIYFLADPEFVTSEIQADLARTRDYRDILQASKTVLEELISECSAIFNEAAVLVANEDNGLMIVNLVRLAGDEVIVEARMQLRNVVAALEASDAVWEHLKDYFATFAAQAEAINSHQEAYNLAQPLYELANDPERFLQKTLGIIDISKISRVFVTEYTIDPSKCDLIRLYTNELGLEHTLTVDTSVLQKLYAAV